MDGTQVSLSTGGSRGQAFAFLFPCFPTEPRKSTLCPGRKHWKPNTTSPFNPDSLDHSTQGGSSYRSLVCCDMYLKVLPHIYISVSTNWSQVLVLLHRWSSLQNSQGLVCFSIAGAGYGAKSLRRCVFPRNTSTATMACVR